MELEAERQLKIYYRRWGGVADCVKCKISSASQGMDWGLGFTEVGNKA